MGKSGLDRLLTKFFHLSICLAISGFLTFAGTVTLFLYACAHRIYFKEKMAYTCIGLSLGIAFFIFGLMMIFFTKRFKKELQSGVL